MRRFFYLLLPGLILVACTAPVTATPAVLLPPPVVSSVPASVPTFTPEPSVTATLLPVATETLTPVVGCIGLQALCIVDGHFFFQRPIGAADNLVVDKTYRFGTTQLGAREPHHGVEFPNKRGTPVLAAQDGTVVVGGDDKTTLLGWVPNFYGNVVLLEHHLPGVSFVVYSLYAHLDEVLVRPGDVVKMGDEIGRVGATGTAVGSHLHFEIRLSPYDYGSSRNPELWLVPVPGAGVLAGRVQDVQGNPVKSAVNLQQVQAGNLSPLSFADTMTYERKDKLAVQSDSEWNENFAVGDLPAGEYRVSLIFNGKLYEQFINIEPGRLTFLVIVVE